jgi:uncharacterized protein (DUF952 family)
MTRPLFHIVDHEVWSAAAEAGEYRPASLDTEGFVHCSFAEQVAPVADARFAGVAGLCVVELDPSRVGEIRVEDSYGEGRVFPHVYGPLPIAAAVAIHPLPRDPQTGAARFEPELSADRAADAASPDR